MCLSTVYIESGDQKQEVMQDVARIQAEDEGFSLTGLLGEKKFVRGQIKSIDFVYEHSVVLYKT